MTRHIRSRLAFVMMMVGVLALMVIPVSPAYAATCTSSSAGDWQTITWTGCASGPQTGDDVIIANTVTINGSTVLPATLNSLTVNNGGTLTVGSTTNHTITVSGNVVINTGGVFQINRVPGPTHTHTLNVGGNFTNSGTFTTVNSNDVINVTFNGAIAQTINGSTVTAFNNLTLNNANGLTLSTNAIVNATFTFTNGRLTTGANTLILPTTATISGASTSRYVYGNIQRAFTSGSLTFNFPIGDASLYAPLSLTFAGISTGGNVTASVTGADCSAISSSTIDSTRSVNHCWTLTNSGTVFTSYNATFTYGNGSDVDAGATPANFIVQRYTAATWSSMTLSGAASGTNAAITGVTAMGDFAIGQPKGTPTLSVTNSPVIYNGSPQAATVSGSVAGTVSDVKYDGSSTVPTNAGTYAITADFTPDEPASYTQLNDAPGNFVINKVTPTLSVTNSPVTYNGSPQAAAVNASVTGTINNILTDGSATQTDAGTYAVTADFTPTDTTNYNSLTGAVAGNFIIAPASSTTTVSCPGSVTYNGVAQTPCSATVIGAGGLSQSLTVTYTNNTNAGTAAATATFAGDANHNPSSDSTTFDITAKNLTVTGLTADDKPYDGTMTAALNTAGATLVGVVPGDDVTLDDSPAVGVFASPNVGTWTVTISGLTLTGPDSGNYTLTQPTATASITGATLTVDGITAENKVYDGNTTASLNTTGATLVGVVPGDDVILDDSLAVGVFASPNVGDWTITISGLTLTGLDAGKYGLAQPTTTASITSRPITVTANSGQGKAYGAGDPIFTYTHDPLLGTDTFSGALSRVAGEDVGAYEITQGDLSAGSNYSITFVPANFTITKANTTISLTSSLNPSVAGASVTFTATVTPATGTVQFYADGVAIGSAVTLSGGTASISTATLSAGIHAITATYSGNSNLNTSTSDPFEQIVGAAADNTRQTYLPIIVR